MPFAIAAAGITAAGAIGGSLIQSGATSKAGNQAQATLAQSRNDLLPWMTQGGTALTATGDLSGANGPDAAKAAMGNFFTSPGYDFRLSEGLRGVDAGAASHGMLRSGATIKAEDKFSQGLASDEFTNYYNRLAGLSGQGLDAARAEAGVGGQSANTAIGSGNAQSSIFGNASSGLGSSISGLASNPKINDLFSGGGSGTGFIDPTSTFV
jgi:hypothetical protein